MPLVPQEPSTAVVASCPCSPWTRCDVSVTVSCRHLWAGWGLEAGVIFLLIVFCLRVQSDIYGIGVVLAQSFICMQSCQEQSVIWLCSLDGATQRSPLNNGKPLFCHSKTVLKSCSRLGLVACLVCYFIFNGFCCFLIKLWAFSGSCLPC